MTHPIPRPPQRRHWQKLRAFRANQPKYPVVELEEFLSFWEVSNAELAEICQCSISTVEKWFINPSSPSWRYPSLEHKHKLAEVHFLWWAENSQQRTQRAERIRQLYNQRPRTLAPGGVGHG